MVHSIICSIIKHLFERLFLSQDDLIEELSNKSLLLINSSEKINHQQKISFKQSPQPSINKQFDRLIQLLNDNHKSGFENFIFCSNESQKKRLNDIFEETDRTVHYKTEVCPLHEGFEDMEAKVACFTDHQIFERYHKYKIHSSAAKKEILTLKELTNLNIGDFVTHIDHGIGKFGGLKKIDVEGVLQEAIKLIYGEGDILYLMAQGCRKR